MTAVKCKQEYKTLLDFSNTKRKVSKNLVKQLLRQTDVVSYHEDGRDMVHTTYSIIIGDYKIKLFLNRSHLPFRSHQKLKQYGTFEIELSEKWGNYYKVIGPKDYRFKNQYWVEFFRPIRMNDLANAIVYCSRLSNLKAFL